MLSVLLLLHFPYASILVTVTVQGVLEYDLTDPGTIKVELPLVLKGRRQEAGVYNFVVNWGDGTKQHITQARACSHTYKRKGMYLVSIGAPDGAIRPVIQGLHWKDERSVIVIAQWGGLERVRFTE